MTLATLPPKVANPEELARALAAARFLLFKHSTRCPISAAAFAEYQAFHRAHLDIPTAWLDVIEQRPLSEQVSVATGIVHESPQVILVEDGRVAWQASHSDVTRRAIETALGMPSGLGGG